MNKIIVGMTMATLCMGTYALAEPRVVQEASGYNSWRMSQAIGEKLVCVYSRGTSHTIGEDARAVYARTSTDNGKTWTPETVVANTSGYGEVAVGKGLDSKGAMFLWVRRMNGSECVLDLYRTTDGVTFVLVATPKLAVAPYAGNRMPLESEISLDATRDFGFAMASKGLHWNCSRPDPGNPKRSLGCRTKTGCRTLLSIIRRLSKSSIGYCPQLCSPA